VKHNVDTSAFLQEYYMIRIDTAVEQSQTLMSLMASVKNIISVDLNTLMK